MVDRSLYIYINGRSYRYIHLMNRDHERFYASPDHIHLTWGHRRRSAIRPDRISETDVERTAL